MGLLDKQMRIIGLVISILIVFTFSYILIIGFNQLYLLSKVVLVGSILIVSLCAVGQIKYYKSPGSTYTLLTLPGAFIAIFFAFF